MANTPPATPGLEFPCRFPIKIMGHKHPEFAPTMVAVTRVHAPDFEEVDLVVRESSAGTYLAVTVTVQAQSQAQLDDLYRALTGHPMVKMVF